MSTTDNTLALSSSRRGLIIVTIMLVAILEVLDSTIVNVALPSMMPSLSADQDQITWVLTSYVVAAAMMLPLTGFLSNRLGYKRLLVIDILGFMISSFSCGLSQSLGMMVFFRLLQGGFGAALIPLSQSILRESFPLEEQGKAMAIWGIGIMAAPVFGPTLGGFITEQASWRWIFYLNAPICIIGILLTLFVIPSSEMKYKKIDWLGILLMFAGVGSLQMFLDQGNNKDWLNSNFILSLMVICIICITLFLYRCVKEKNPVMTLSIYKDRNFALCSLCLAIFCGSVFGLITLQPLMLESLFNYPSIVAGITMAPLGIASAFGMMITSALMTRINVKYILGFSLLVCSAGSYYLAGFNLNSSQSDFFIGDAILGFGMGFFMVPISTYALATIDMKHITESSGLFGYARMLGTSIGVSLLSTLVSRETQINWNQLGGNITATSGNLRVWLQSAHMQLSDPATPIIIGRQIASQAGMIAFIDAYLLIAISFICLIPLVLMMKTVDLKDAGPMAH